MGKHIKFTLDSGEEILIEAAEAGAEEAYGRVGRGEIIEEGGRFADAVRSIKPAVEQVLEVFREMEAPDEIALEFALKFEAEVGVVIAKGTTGANFKVSVKWARGA